MEKCVDIFQGHIPKFLLVFKIHYLS